MNKKNKKVILFFPAVDFFNAWIPLSVFSLAPSIEAEGFEPIIIDGNIEKDPYKILLNHLDECICIGVSCKIGSQIRGAVEFSKFVKSKHPQIPIIWGGYLPTLEPDMVLGLPYIDAVVVGQGQLTFKEVIKALSENKSLNGIKGVHFKEKGKIVKNKKRDITPLKFLPSVKYTNDTKKYLRNAVASKTMMYNSSEGCPHGCTFCSVSKFFDAKWYAQTANKIVKNIKKIILETGANGIFFCDSNFFADTKRVKSICQKLIKERLDIKWRAYGRISQFVRLKPNMLRLLQKSGFSELTVGAESGAQCILDNIKKDTSLRDILRLADLCSKYNISVRFLFMVGFPGTTEQVKKEIDATLSISQRLINDYPQHEVHWNCYKPLSLQEMLIAQNYGFKNPLRIEDWIGLGDFSSLNSPWINKKMDKYLNSLLHFYIPAAKPLQIKTFYSDRGVNLIDQIINFLAKWRINNHFFSIPFEYWINKKLKTFRER